MLDLFYPPKPVERAPTYVHSMGEWEGEKTTYYERHKAEMCAKQKAYREANKEKLREARRRRNAA